MGSPMAQITHVRIAKITGISRSTASRPYKIIRRSRKRHTCGSSCWRRNLAIGQIHLSPRWRPVAINSAPPRQPFPLPRRRRGRLPGILPPIRQCAVSCAALPIGRLKALLVPKFHLRTHLRKPFHGRSLLAGQAESARNKISRGQRRSQVKLGREKPLRGLALRVNRPWLRSTCSCGAARTREPQVPRSSAPRNLAPERKRRRSHPDRHR